MVKSDVQKEPALEDLIAMVRMVLHGAFSSFQLESQEEAAKKAAEDAKYEPAEPPVTFSVPGTTQHYTRREQIRDPDSMEWIPYRRPRAEHGPPPPDDPNNLFFLNSRRDYRGGIISTQFLLVSWLNIILPAPPTLIISSLSQPLLLFLRYAVFTH
jgi:hypothetical protein